MKSRLLCIVVAAGFAASPGVYAHGADAHGGKPNLEKVEKPFGRTGDPKRVTRTIQLSGDDTMRYKPAQITVKQGETIRFVMRNNGQAMHEIVIGTLDELKQHAELMQKNPGMEHDEPYMAHVAPGKTGQIVWTFDKAGEFHFGCLVPGHFEAGMRGTITVAPR